METNAKFTTLNNALGAMDELQILGASSELHVQIKTAIRAVMQSLAQELAESAQAAQEQNGQATSPTADTVLTQTPS